MQTACHRCHMRAHPCGRYTGRRPPCAPSYPIVDPAEACAMAPKKTQSCPASGDLVSQLGGECPGSGQSTVPLFHFSFGLVHFLTPLHSVRTGQYFTAFTVPFFHSLSYRTLILRSNRLRTAFFSVGRRIRGPRPDAEAIGPSFAHTVPRRRSDSHQ